MKITKTDIQKVLLDESTAAASKEAENFPTTDADWERFRKRFEKPTAEDSKAPSRSSARLQFFAICATLTIVALVVVIQFGKGVKVVFKASIDRLGGRAPSGVTPGVSTSNMGDFGNAKENPGNTTVMASLPFTKADAFRGDNPGANPANTPKWIADQHLDIQWNLAEQTLSLPLLDGTVVPVKLAPAPELNLNDEAGLRFFRLNETSTTLRAGESVQIRGTLQIRATQLAAADTTPKRLSEVESALFKLKLTAKDGRSQDLWYEFKR